MCIGATITPCFRYYANGVSSLAPFFNAYLETIQA